MKKLIITTVIMLYSLLVMGQATETENYVKVTTYRAPVENQQDIDGLQDDQKIEQVNYADGLGRTKQSVAIKAGGNKEDIITHFEFDGLGRQTKKYLPFSQATSGDGAIYIDPLVELNSQYLNKYPLDLDANAPNPYAEVLYEKSTSNRVLEQGAPGEDWAINPTSDEDHTIVFKYKTNTVNEVRRFEVEFSNNNTETPSLKYIGHYNEHSLYKTITKDENWTPAKGKNHTTEEFKNKQGQVLLKRTYNGNTNPHDTYYVYDRFGNLTYVLSPKGSDSILDANNQIQTSVLNDLCYQYKYDYRNRLIEKKIPGKGWEYIVYDKLDRPILTQDTNLSLLNPKQWLFTKYDAFGRVIYTGKYSNNASRETLQTLVNSQTEFNETQTNTPTIINNETVFYTNNNFPSNNIIELLSINYYDNYNSELSTAIPNPLSVFGTPVSLNAKSLATGSKVKIIDTNYWITTVSYYDDKSRPIFIGTKNEALLTQDNVLTQYDFIGNVLKTEAIHNKIGNSQINVQNEYTYDHQNRLLTDKQRINTLEIIDVVNLELNGSTITKPGINGNGWYNGFASSTKLINNGYISWNVSSNSSYAMVGLSEENSGVGYGTIEYALYAHNGKLQVYESGIKKFDGNTSNNGLYNTTDVLSVHRINGDTIVYKRNDDVIYTSSILNSQELIIDGAIHKARVSIYNLQMYNAQQELIAKNTYDELGQLKTKEVGNTEITPLQTVDYTYNIRGWLTHINNPDNLGTDLFGFKISYNTPEVILDGNTAWNTASPLYNGNISETQWKTANLNHNNETEKHSYIYNYDALNRIKNAYFGFGDNYNYTGAFNLYIPSYDKNGNIIKLFRNGMKFPGTGDYTAKPFDKLIYSYNGNQLTEVDDQYNVPEGYNEGANTGTGQDYSYDANGNLTKDSAKEISSIDYNHLNLPTQISFYNGSSINYLYDATGVKLKKEVNNITNNTTTTTKYAGNYIYNNDELKFLNHVEGYIEPTNNGTYNYIYQYKDHLGNIRLSYSDFDGNEQISATTEILEENNYYPFGLKHKGYNEVVSANINSLAKNWKYNSVELNESLDLNLYEMPLRQYDPSLGKFMSIDPVIHFSNSTYNGFDNNPIYWADPSGADGECYTCIDSGANGSIVNNVGSTNSKAINESDIEKDNNDCENCPKKAKVNDVYNDEENELSYIYKKDGWKVLVPSAELEEVWISNKFTSKEDWIKAMIWAQRFEGFSDAFNEGWNGWDKDGIANFWMNFSSLSIGSSLALPIASATGSSLGIGGLRTGLLDANATALVYGTRAYSWVNVYGNHYISANASTFVSWTGAKYLKNTPTGVRKILFNKGMYRFFNNPSIYHDYSKSLLKIPFIFGKAPNGTYPYSY